MGARGALVAFGLLLSATGVVVALTAPATGASGTPWQLCVSVAMILAALAVTAFAALAGSRRDHDRG